MRYSQINRKNKIIDVTLYLREYPSEVAVSRIHQPSIRRELQMTNTQISAYEDFLDTIASIITNHGFRIINEYQSKRSYAYYMTFEVPDIQETWTIRFRIADHDSCGTFSSSRDSNRPTIFRKIIIGNGQEFTSYFQAIKAVGYICDGLVDRDFDVLNVPYKDMGFED